MKTIILQEAYRTITVRDGDRQVSVPMAQAIVRAMAVNAAKGQHRAQRLFAELLAATETANKALADEWLDTAMTYKIEWERELERRQRLGLTGLPEPLPHPDHIVIDMDTGLTRVVGPSTREEKAKYDHWMSRRATFLDEIAHFDEMIAEEEDPDVRAFMEKDRQFSVSVLEKLDSLMETGGWKVLPRRTGEKGR